MLKEIKTMEQMKDAALRLDPSIRIIFIDDPNWEDEFIPNSKNVSENRKTYDVTDKRKALVFIEADGGVYLLPYLWQFEKILKASGYEKSNIGNVMSGIVPPIVPKSVAHHSWEVYRAPANDDAQLKWWMLNKEAVAIRDGDWVKECCDYADDKGYGEISSKLIKYCIEVPKNMLEISILTETKEISTRNITQFMVDKECNNKDCIGQYVIWFNLCVFVYRNGKTYITQNHNVVKALRKAGYYKAAK